MKPVDNRKANAGHSIEKMRGKAWKIVGSVSDPEIPVVSIADLGVLRDIHIEQGRIEVFITPTYSGCPAMNVIACEIERALVAAGFVDVQVRTVLWPAWTTDWITEEGRRKLREFGIAPPKKVHHRHILFDVETVACPHCGATDTVEVAGFGSTACKALWRCNACREPFDYFKCH